MKIVHLRSSDQFGSPERLIIGQCRHLPQHQFVCASFVRRKQHNRFLQACREVGLTAAAIGESFAPDMRVVKKIKNLLTRSDADLLVTHDYKSNFYGYLATATSRHRHLAYFHGITSEDEKVRLYNVIDRFVLKRITPVVTVSRVTKEFLVSRGLAAGAVVVIPNAVDSERIRKRAPRQRGSDSPLNLVAAGRFSREKGLDLLLEAIAVVRADCPAFVLHLYGQGPEETRLRKMVNDLKLQERVRFGGFVDDILPVFETMDFLVLPSRSEGMPVIVLEAWSRALGVLAAGVGGIPEMITDGVSGLLVAPDDVEALAEKLRWVLHHPSEMERLGATGQELVREKYTFAAQAPRLDDIYVACLQSQPQRYHFNA